MSKNGTIYIPGKITMEESVELAKLAKDRNVIQIGAYCGRATIALALACKRLWVLDDFQYPGGAEAIVEELKRNVKEAGVDDKISFIYGDGERFTVIDDIPSNVTLVYRDANRPDKYDNGDAQFVVNVLGAGGVYAWHSREILDPVRVSNELVAGNHVGSKLKWMQIVPKSEIEETKFLLPAEALA